MQPPFKLRNSKWCSVSSLTVIEYLSDQQRFWSVCAYAQADLRLCWSHIPHCWKSHVAAHSVLQRSKSDFSLIDSDLFMPMNYYSCRFFWCRIGSYIYISIRYYIISVYYHKHCLSFIPMFSPKLWRHLRPTLKLTSSVSMRWLQTKSIILDVTLVTSLFCSDAKTIWATC